MKRIIGILLMTPFLVIIVSVICILVSAYLWQAIYMGVIGVSCTLFVWGLSLLD